MEDDMTILGCITKYKADDIRPYVESIEQTGFKGRKVMLVYEYQKKLLITLNQKDGIYMEENSNNI